MIKRSWIALALLLAGCGPICILYRDTTLGIGGLYVAHIERRSCDGCEPIEPGDHIQTLDGQPVADDLGALGDGEPHVIGYWDRSLGAQATATITVTPLAEPTGALPIWSIEVGELKRAPDWARRRMFGRAIPELLLIDERGEPLTGLDLFGRSHVVVLFDWAASADRQNAALCMKVLQKAQADLAAKGIEIVFAHVQHPVERSVPPMSDADLQTFFANNQVQPQEGGPLPAPPLYRTPNKTEHHKPRGIDPTDIYEQLGEPPNILLIDERGIVRWHSAGSVSDPEGKITVDMVYTINKAVLFALEHL